MTLSDNDFLSGVNNGAFGISSSTYNFVAIIVSFEQNYKSANVFPFSISLIILVPFSNLTYYGANPNAEATLFLNSQTVELL
jgi:hypothetical protein